MKSKRTYFKKIRNYTILIAFLIIIETVCIYIFKNLLLKNLAETQTALSSSAAISLMHKDTGSLGTYEAVLAYAANQMDVRFNNNDPEELITTEGITYVQTLYEMFGRDTVSPSIMYNGQCIPENDNKWLAEYYAALAHYSNSSSDPVIFTDIFIDPIVGKPVIAAVTQCKKADAILALKINIENLGFYSAAFAASDSSDFYLCDSKGSLIAAQLRTEHDDSASAQKFIDNHFDDIRSGKLDRSGCAGGYTGHHIGIYYTVLPNGWYSIVTASHDPILHNRNLIIFTFTAAIVLIAVIGSRDIRLSIKASRSDETLKVLGNLYFAIYRINFMDETYEIIKGSDYVSRNITKTGSYDLFLDTVLEVISPQVRAEFKSGFSCENIRVLVENGIKNYGGDFHRCFGESELWINVRMLYDENISSDEIILVFKDSESEKQRSLNEIKLLENALEVAKHSEKTKQDFFKNMSHDMRTPLNAIIGLSSLAAENIGDEKKTLEHLNSIKKSGQTLLELVNEILDMSRIQDGTLRLNYHPINICDCINDCASAFITQARHERKEFKVRFKVKNKLILGDDVRIRQIVTNLLSNAFKFTDAGDAVFLTVSQAVCENFSQYTIVVSDTGIGMSESFLCHVFEPYARETIFSANQVEGTGLGLPIVKNIVSQMSGEITVESTLHKGSRFTVTLPFSAADEPSEAPVQNEKKHFSFDGKNILLAEDNILNMEVASEILKMNGVNVTEAWNGAEAVEAFEKSEPFFFDAILMDMQMPKMDGCEAVRTIRKMHRPDSALVPIIAVTANAFSEDIIATSAAGMNDHISKPIDMNVLCQSIEKHLNI